MPLRSIGGFQGANDTLGMMGVWGMEKTVSLTCVAAICLWGLTFVLIFSGSALGVATGDDHMPLVLTLMAHGLACSAAAATMSIRLMLRRQTRMLRDVFELGRDAGSGPPVRRVH